VKKKGTRKKLSLTRAAQPTAQQQQPPQYGSRQFPQQGQQHFPQQIPRQNVQQLPNPQGSQQFSNLQSAQTQQPKQPRKLDFQLSTVSKPTATPLYPAPAKVAWGEFVEEEDDSDDSDFASVLAS
jgi:hypothetical protein